MAHSKQALKRVRQSEKARLKNKSRLTRIKTFIKKFEQALETGKKEDAKKAFIKAESELAKGVKNGIFKKNTVARKTSRLSKKLSLKAK